MKLATIVKAMKPDGTTEYFLSLEDCCAAYGIKYHKALTKLINEAGLAPDGRTFFDYPTDFEAKELLKNTRRKMGGGDE